ncbi:TetR/AcrR family transcriptional regulator [Domibacillus antri]|uniref:TetR/AcrR family transcriptional regulator n=1 Tax=Domibacillus antri TaxID=1714264 RepID=UPI00094D208A|nr:TetR/AcrR family transcriptional regulator [Domibacillus antri]
MNEKKRKILLAAMKLFSKKSFHQTSMQQIADVCGLSKGSLYTHFKSKEELLSDIFVYYYQILHDQIAASRQESDTVHEAFVREVAIRTRHYCAFQEFFLMQVKEIRGLEDPTLNQFVRRENLQLMQRTEKRIIDMYGPDVKPYAADLTASLKGMMISYLQEIIEKESPCDFDELARYLVSQLDAMAGKVLNDKPMPFFESYLLQGKECKQEEAVHPLHILKKLKEAVQTEKETGILMDSVIILEQELLEVKPRHAILEGMLFNLKKGKMTVKLAEELEQALKKMPETIHL